MNTSQKIAVIGGTGKSGKYLVNTLIAQGYSIKVLVRNPERAIGFHPLAETIIGDVRDPQALKGLISGCGAIVSTLGMGVPASEPTIFSQATTNIIEVMKECNVRRYIVVTGLNVDTPFDAKGPKAKAATDWMHANYPRSTADRQLEYDLLCHSNIDWTMVRVPLIEQTDERGMVSISLTDCAGEKISATDLAFFLVGQLTDTAYLKAAPFIANG